jgi:hypothetical protein
MLGQIFHKSTFDNKTAFTFNSGINGAPIGKLSQNGQVGAALYTGDICTPFYDNINATVKTTNKLVCVIGTLAYTLSQDSGASYIMGWSALYDATKLTVTVVNLVTNAIVGHIYFYIPAQHCDWSPVGISIVDGSFVVVISRVGATQAEITRVYFTDNTLNTNPYSIPTAKRLCGSIGGFPMAYSVSNISIAVAGTSRYLHIAYSATLVHTNPGGFVRIPLTKALNLYSDVEALAVGNTSEYLEVRAGQIGTGLKLLISDNTVANRIWNVTDTGVSVYDGADAYSGGPTFPFQSGSNIGGDITNTLCFYVLHGALYKVSRDLTTSAMSVVKYYVSGGVVNAVLVSDAYVGTTLSVYGTKQTFFNTTPITY